jgi:hypothetical protein
VLLVLLLTIVPCFDCCESLFVLFDQVCQLEHQFSSFCAGNVSPFSFEGLSCCGDGLVDVLGCGGFDRADLTLIAVSYVLAIVMNLRDCGRQRSQASTG